MKYLNPIRNGARWLCLGLLALTTNYPGYAGMNYQETFESAGYGMTPAQWRDPSLSRPTRAWAVDANGYLRYLLKKQFGSFPDDRTGVLLLVEAGSGLDSAAGVSDGTLSADFRMTEDESVSFALVARALDGENYYAARFSGTGRLELLKSKAGELANIDFIAPTARTELLALSGTRPPGLISLRRYREGEVWKLIFEMKGELLTASVLDGAGVLQARVQARDGDFAAGFVGVRSTRFVGISRFALEAETVRPRNVSGTFATAFQAPPDRLPMPIWNHAKLVTSRSALADSYDLMIAGGGTGGFGAALQASRMGLRVLLLEETDWLGGQMAAGVTTMDEASGWWKYSVRERGIYREFNEAMLVHYLGKEKDPMLAYYTYPHQTEGGYEPSVAQAVIYGFLQQERERGHVIDISLRSRIVGIEKEGNAVRSAVVEFLDEQGRSSRSISCGILIDATEYGDVIPLTGARYRSGNTISPNIALAAPVQDHTWLAIVKEYPEGVPAHLRIDHPPPGYQRIKRRFSNYLEHGHQIWGPEARGLPAPTHWRRYIAWRGLVDSSSPLTGSRSSERHTRSGFNGGNDYPVTAATLETPAQRLIDEREGIYRSLGILYYLQTELGLPWSVAEDEGYDTFYNRWKMGQLEIRPDLMEVAVRLPQQPYVRESRRIVGIGALSGNAISERDEKATLFPTSVAMGDYGMDLDHGDTANSYEPDLDSGQLAPHSGPFMVPFEAFVPELIDGLLAAEKNISQSRRASGATRMQPSTMLTGQAAGAIAAMAILKGVEPRNLKRVEVQAVLLDAGSTLVPRWHVDVPFRSSLWKATQLLSLYQVLDRPGFLTKDMRPLAVDHPWGVNEPLAVEELQSAVARLGALAQAKPAVFSTDGPAVSRRALRTALAGVDPAWGRMVDEAEIANAEKVTAGEFALVASRCLQAIEAPVLP
jgi:hypothetical protein